MTERSGAISGAGPLRAFVEITLIPTPTGQARANSRARIGVFPSQGKDANTYFSLSQFTPPAFSLSLSRLTLRWDILLYLRDFLSCWCDEFKDKAKKF